MERSASSGTLNDEMGDTMRPGRNDAVWGPTVGQATLRRLLSGNSTSDRVPTPVTFGKTGPRSRSDTGRTTSPIRKIYSQNPTEGNFGFSKHLMGDNSEPRTPEDSESREHARESEAKLVSDTVHLAPVSFMHYVLLP